MTLSQRLTEFYNMQGYNDQLSLSSDEFKKINLQAFYEEYFTMQNTYTSKSVFDPVIPPDQPLFKVPFPLKELLSHITNVSIVLTSGSFQLDFSRFTQLTQIVIQGPVSPQIHFSETNKQMLKRLSIYNPLETAQILLSSIDDEIQQYIMGIKESDIVKSSSILEPQLCFQTLTHLNLSNCKLYVMDSSFLLLTNLYHLNLSHNSISKVAFLQNSIFLCHLDLSFNNIQMLTDINRIIGRTSVLKLRGNRITQTRDIIKLKSLEVLDIADNLINNPIEISLLNQLPLLQDLFVSGNPSIQTDGPQSRREIIRLLFRQVNISQLMLNDEQITTEYANYQNNSIYLQIDSLVLNGLQIEPSEVSQFQKALQKQSIKQLSYTQRCQLNRFYSRQYNKYQNAQQLVRQLTKANQNIIRTFGVDYMNQYYNAFQAACADQGSAIDKDLQRQVSYMACKDAKRLDARFAEAEGAGEVEQLLELNRSYLNSQQCTTITYSGGQDLYASTRPDGNFPFGRAVPHQTDSQQLFRQHQLPVYAARFLGRQGGGSRAAEAQLNFRSQLFTYQQNMRRDDYRAYFDGHRAAGGQAERRGLLCPALARRRGAEEVRAAAERRAMAAQERLDRVYNLLRGFARRLEARLEALQLSYVVGCNRERGGGLTVAEVDAAANRTTRRLEARRLAELLGLEQFVPVGFLLGQPADGQHLVLRALAGGLRALGVPGDLALWLLGGYVRQALAQLRVPGADERAALLEKRARLGRQEQRQRAEQRVAERRARFAGVLRDEAQYRDNPMYQLVSYVAESKLLEKRVELQERAAAPGPPRDDAGQLLGARRYAGYTIYKFYSQERGRVVYIRRRLVDGEEQSDEDITDPEELGRYERDEQDEIAQRQREEEERRRREEEKLQMFEEELYRADPDELVRTLSVCVPYGERQVYVEPRKVRINATTGLLQEFNDQNELVAEADLKTLVAYILPKSDYVENIYKCVVLLFCREAGADGAEDDIDIEKLQNEYNEGGNATEQGAEYHEHDAPAPFGEAATLQQTDFNNYNPFSTGGDAISMFGGAHPGDTAYYSNNDVFYNPFYANMQYEYNPYGEYQQAAETHGGGEQPFNQREISTKEVVDALPIIPLENIVRPELRIALPGVTESYIQDIIMHTLNLQTDYTYDPLRVSHSFSGVEYIKNKKTSYRYVLIYYLSSQPVYNKNMSTLSSYTELLELIAPALMRAYSPELCRDTFWGYCLRCCKTFRAVKLQNAELIDYGLDITQSNQHAYNISDNSVQRKAKLLDAKKEGTLYINDEEDYYQTNNSYIKYFRYSADLYSTSQVQPQVILCPHCSYNNSQVNQFSLNIDYRRKVKAIENLQTGKPINTKAVIECDNYIKYNLEVDNVIWESISYRTFSIYNAQRTREVVNFSYREDVSCLEKYPEGYNYDGYYNAAYMHTNNYYYGQQYEYGCSDADKDGEGADGYNENMQEPTIMYWIIQRPFDLPNSTNEEKYLYYVSDNMQRYILIDAFKYIDIPEPSKRYLKALGDIDQMELFDNVLPRQETNASNLEEDSQVSKSNSEAFDVESEGDQELGKYKKISEIIIIKDQVEQLSEDLFNNQLQQNRISQNILIYPFDIFQYNEYQMQYYTTSQSQPIVYFRGYFDKTSQEWEVRDKARYETVLKVLLNAERVNLENFVGMFSGVFANKQAGAQQGQNIGCLVLLFGDSITYVFKKVSSSQQSQHVEFGPLTDQDVYQLQASQFTRITKKVSYLNSVEYDYYGLHVKLVFSKQIIQNQKYEINGVENTKNYQQLLKLTNMVNDMHIEKPDFLYFNTQQQLEFVTMLQFMKDTYGHSYELFDQSDEMDKKLRSMSAIFFGEMLTIGRYIPNWFKVTNYYVSEQEYILKKPGYRHAGIHNQYSIVFLGDTIFVCRYNAPVKKLDYENESRRSASHITYVFLDKEELDKLTIFYNDAPMYVLHFQGWRERVAFVIWLERHVQDELEIGAGLNVQVG